MQLTGIEYLDFSWNPTHGCSKISAGCKNCWAEPMAKRLAGNNVRGYEKADPFKPTECPWKLNEPFEVKKLFTIGVSFMGDLFHDQISWSFIDRVFEAMLPWHRYLILTKRIDFAYHYFKTPTHLNPKKNRSEYLKNNVYLGVTVEDNDSLWRIPRLLSIPAMVHFVSLEPLLEEVNIEEFLHCGISWCIIGAESGRGARFMNENWVRKVVAQCKQANVLVFYKQKIENGKKISIPTLDGVKYQEFPQIIDRQNEN